MKAWSGAPHRYGLRTIAAGVVTDHPLALTAASSTAGLLVVSGTLPFWPPGWAAAFSHLATLALVIGSGLLLQGIAVTGFNYGLSQISAGRAAILFPLISVLVAMGGVVWFGEALTHLQLLGGALIKGCGIAVARTTEAVPPR